MQVVGWVGVVNNKGAVRWHLRTVAGNSACGALLDVPKDARRTLPAGAIFCRNCWGVLHGRSD